MDTVSAAFLETINVPFIKVDKAKVFLARNSCVQVGSGDVNNLRLHTQVGWIKWMKSNKFRWRRRGDPWWCLLG